MDESDPMSWLGLMAVQLPFILLGSSIPITGMWWWGRRKARKQEDSEREVPGAGEEEVGREKPGWFGGWKRLRIAVLWGVRVAATPGILLFLAWNTFEEFRSLLGWATVLPLLLVPVYVMRKHSRPNRAKEGLENHDGRTPESENQNDPNRD